MMKTQIARYLAMMCLCAATTQLTTAFSTPPRTTTTTTTTTTTAKATQRLMAVPASQSRRDVLLTGITACLVASPIPAAAAAKQSQETIDKANILKGYDRLVYLLDNWEKETTVCAIGGDSLERRCERTPIKVMEYMGFKATTDPLFKADKTMMRLYAVAPAARDGEYIDAVERYTENAEAANGMAFISSWGEANPGGGKDRVQLFIERARKNVIVAKESLETAIDILELK
mmetsp:Transcript_9971/g.27255  ORF Transcript_9971/g.27255 Transcript_9971/m.27255 type:complete len:231 (+) Transcript_9971:2082-2774(+)